MSATPAQRSCTLCFVGCLLLLGCSDIGQDSKAAAGGETSVQREIHYSLNATQKSVVQWIGPELREPEKQKFVQIELSKVSNPDKQPIIFEVYFQAENREKIFLGTFSPYPPDSTGNFIVATKGRLRSRGAVVLSMVLPEGTEANTSLNVEARKFTFREK